MFVRNKERNIHLKCGQAEKDPLAHRGAGVVLAARDEPRLRAGVVLVLDGATRPVAETCCSKVRLFGMLTSLFESKTISKSLQVPVSNMHPWTD